MTPARRRRLGSLGLARDELLLPILDVVSPAYSALCAANFSAHLGCVRRQVEGYAAGGADFLAYAGQDEPRAGVKIMPTPPCVVHLVIRYINYTGWHLA
jgi:hypothetical protein